MSSSCESSSGSTGSSSDEQPGSQPRKRAPRTATKWPSDKITVTGLKEDGLPSEKKARQRMRKLTGLVARQIIPLATEYISEIKKADRQELFENYIQSKLEFPAEIKQDAFKKAWVMIAKSRRNFRSTLATRFVAKGIEPFTKHKFLKPKDWEKFINHKSTQEAIEKSEKGKELRSKNKHDHKLGPTGYEGAIPKWEAEDAKLAAEGKTNPWKAYPGRTCPWMRARGTMSDEGEISFKSSETQQVSQKVLEKASQSGENSVTGVREHDILTQALGNAEHRGRVRGFSSYSSWRSWPQCEGMYKKKKARVDMRSIEEMVEEKLARERVIMEEGFMQKMASMLAAHGLALVPPSPVAEPFSSEASVGHLELRAQALALHPMDRDKIDGLDQPTSCILQIIREDAHINVARGQVLPSVTILHTVEVDRSRYAVVHVDWVDVEYYDEPLPVPNDEISTLREALLQRILWEKAHILCKIPPSNAKEKENGNEKEKMDVPLAGKTQIVPFATEKEKSKEKIDSSKEQQHTKESKNSKKSNKNGVAPVWTSANPNFKLGQAILSVEELRRLGGQALQLHNYYMRSWREKKCSITLRVKPNHFQKVCDDYVVVNFSNLYDLYHHTSMDISLLQVFTLSYVRDARLRKKPVGFLDPNALAYSQLKAGGNAKQEVTSYLTKALSHFHGAGKKYAMFAYNAVNKQGSSHWVLVVIILVKREVWYLDSLRHANTKYTELRKVIDKAFAVFQKHHGMNKEKLTHIFDFECHQQEAGSHCGFYCCHHMFAIVDESDVKNPEDIKFTSAPLTVHDFNNVTQTMVMCLMVDAIGSKGEYYCPVNG